jgi:hypothetical protein
MDGLQIITPGRMPRPRPTPTTTALRARAAAEMVYLDTLLERRATPPRSADDNYDAYEEAKSLLAQYGSLEAALAEAIRRYGRTNGHHRVLDSGPTLRAGLNHPTRLEYSQHEGRILDIR